MATQPNPWEIDWTQQAGPAAPVNVRPGRPNLPSPQTRDQAAIDAARAAAIPDDITARRLGIEKAQREMGRIPEAVSQSTTEAVDAFAALQRATSRFEDDFAGFGAGVENSLQGRGLDFGLATPGQRDFWSDFAAADAVARNRLFGASLTPGEESAFAQTTVSPNMSAEQVRENLTRRMDLARAALSRRINFLRESGYDEGAINALLGEYSGAVGNQQPQQQGQGGQPPERQDGVNWNEMPQGNIVRVPGDQGGPYSTEDDLRHQAQLQTLISRHAAPAEINGYLQAEGLPPIDEAQLRAAVEAHRRGQRVVVDPAMSGNREPSILNRAANSVPGAAVGAYLDTLTGGHLDNIAGAFGEDPERVNYDMSALRDRYPIASLAGDIGAGVSLYGAGRAVAGKVLGRTLPTATRTLSPAAIAGDVALGGYIGSGQDGTDPFSLRGFTTGALTGAGGGLGGRAVINSVGRAISPTGGELAPLYREGVQPTLGQRAGGAVDRFEQATTSVPFVGALPRRARNQSIEQFQRGAFNQALREIGRELPADVSVGPNAHRFMQRSFNDEFQQIRQGMSFTPDSQFAQEFGALQQGLRELDDSSQRIFERMVRDNISNRIRRTGSLSGDDYVRAASRLDARARSIRRSPNGDYDLADALESLSTMLDDAAARQGPPELSQRLTSARAGYRRAVVVEDAARRRGSGQGEFSPTQFDAAVQNVGGGLRSRAYLRGDAPMQDYAAAGLRLGDNLPNSGTVDRILASGAISGAGYAAPWALAPLGVSLAANAPGGRQALNFLLRPRPSTAAFREQILDRAPYGSLLGPAFIPQLGE